MKKLLSVVLALALCLTAMMGCFAVSAETVATSATINIAGGEAIKAGETATVTVTGSDFTDVCAADLVITLPAGFELVSVSEAGEVLVNDENGVYYVYDETANTVKYIDVFNFNEEVKALDLALVVTAPADAEDGEYAVTGAVVAANIDEEFLGVTINNGAITVQNEVLPPEPVVDEDIVCNFGGGLGTSAYISIFFNKSDLTEYASYELVATRYIVGGDYNFTSETKVVDDRTDTSTRTYFYCRGIELYALTVPVTVVLNCKDADGNVVATSKEFTTTLRDSMYNLYSKSGNAAQKTAITDMIVAGAEVQSFFVSGKSCDLANLPLPTEDFPLESATPTLGDLATHNTNGSANGITIGTGGGITLAPYLTFNFSGISNAADYNVTLSYNDEIAGKTVTKTVNLASTDANDVQVSGNRYYVYFREMSIPATNAAVNVSIAKTDAPDTALATYTYCFDQLISARQTHATMGPMFVALGKLGQSFRAFNGF